MMKVSIVSATYNRAKLLDNALLSYSKQTMDFDEWEYLLCDDGKDDGTKEVVDKWIKKGLPIRYFTAEDLGKPKVPGQWRDGCALRNALSTHAFGDVLIATHPEIMIPKNALQIMFDTVQSNPESWVTAIPYWMPNSEMVDGWEKDLFKLTEMEGFYDPNWNGHDNDKNAIDYTNQNQERRTTWDSEVFFALSMDVWREKLCGFREFEVWGSVDMDFNARRRILHVPTVIAKGSDVPSGNLMVFHQWHESKRDMDLAMTEVRKTSYPDYESARKAGGLYPIINHGHREKSDTINNTGILGDHISRYEFAHQYANQKDILDIPCGTGYGAVYITGNSYIGIDKDEKSIQHAQKLYQTETKKFQSGDMEKIPVKSNSVDLLLSFEGLEHIENKEKFVKEMKRVLRPGGTFIISTPHKGVAQGTPWDRFIISPQEIDELFSEWLSKSWFYQMSYGSKNPIIPCRLETIHPKAEIVLLGATVPKKKG